MSRMWNGVLAACSLVAVLSWGAGELAAQQNPPSDPKAIVKDRQDTMKAQGKLLATVKNYTDGKVDQKAAEDALAHLMQLTRSLPGKFPPGTGMAEFPGVSGAKPAIWSDPAKFKDANKPALAQEQTLLDLVKAGDKAAVAAQVKTTVDKGCGACHGIYRQKL